MKIGSNYGKDGRYIFVLEAPVKVKRKKNIITLLSATVGLPVSIAYLSII